ncbi:MAG TPA: KGG domain-containing protein [Methanotrichaceae archaeon]|nr:KGG domain-containing protein [Methanotrichaceae archaeon]
MAEERRKSTGAEENKGTMTVKEAGHIGGEKTAETHGHEFYEEIGHKGGQRVRELIQEGKKVEGEEPAKKTSSSRGRGSEEETSRR